MYAERPISVADFLGDVCAILGFDHTRKNHPRGVDRPVPIVDGSKGMKVLSELLERDGSWCTLLSIGYGHRLRPCRRGNAPYPG